MKKVTLIAIALIANIYISQAQVNLQNGLIGYYPFNGNANDNSLYGMNGTVNGATLTSDRFGNTNGAYTFDGINDYISLPTTKLIDLNKYSYSIWVKLGEIPTFNAGVIYCIGGASNYNAGDGWGQAVSIQNNSKLFAGSYNYGSNPVQSYVYSANVSINQWMHVVVTRDTVSLKMYLNGSLISENTTNVTNNQNAHYGLASLKNAFLGKLCYEDNYFFKGIIDDARFYNRPINQNEVNALYNENICYQTVSVTDTLIINANLSGFNPISYKNTIKIFPNPAKTHINIDFGTEYSTLSGYKIKIINSLNQIVYETNVNQQSTTVNLSTWSGNGLYFVQLIDNNSNIIDIKKIVIQ